MFDGDEKSPNCCDLLFHPGVIPFGRNPAQPISKARSNDRAFFALPTEAFASGW